MITTMKKFISITQNGKLNEMWLEAIWISQYVKKYKKAVAYYIILGILGIGMGLAGSVASKYLIDAVTGYDTGNILFIALVIIGMAVGNIFVGAINSRISIKINLKVNKEIQEDIYQKVMRTDWEAISRYHSGDILNRFNSDVGTVASSVLGWIPSLITRTLQFFGVLGIILYYDSTMAVIALLSAPVTLILSRVLMTRMREYNEKMKQIGSQFMAFNEESFQKIQIIKCFDIIDYFVQRLQKVQKEYIDNVLSYNKFSIYTSSFLSLVSMVVTYLTFGWGVYRLWSGAITYGTMTLFMQLSQGLSGGFSALIGMIPSAISATTSAGRLMDILELPREAVSIKNQEDMDSGSKMKGLSVLLNNIYFHYQGRDQILHNVSMYAKPKEIVALVGPSGAGKTTLMGILLGLLHPSEGEAKIIDSQGLERSISEATRKYFSYVPQGNHIFTGTIAENLRMANWRAKDKDIERALKAAAAYDFVAELPMGIHTKIGENGCGLSEGQAQRISIARALLREAPILLLDEATSALDPVTEKKVLQGIMEYGTNHTCILTTHRISVLEMCHRVYRISDTNLSEVNNEQLLEKAVDF